ncbi:MAG: hypothetical protein M3Z16_11125, partial [Pseudomonadota bacterium]|nr:hypothetical protein [Pseudomonadota bacterium]
MTQESAAGLRHPLPGEGKSIPSADFTLPVLGVPQEGRLQSFFMPTFWASTAPEVVVAAAKEITASTSGGHHFADNMLTWGRNMSML